MKSIMLCVKGCVFKSLMQDSEHVLYESSMVLIQSAAYRSQDDPVTVTVVESATKLRGQLVLINVAQQVCHRGQHYHLTEET